MGLDAYSPRLPNANDFPDPVAYPGTQHIVEWMFSLPPRGGSKNAGSRGVSEQEQER